MLEDGIARAGHSHNGVLVCAMKVTCQPHRCRCSWPVVAGWVDDDSAFTQANDIQISHCCMTLRSVQGLTFSGGCSQTCCKSVSVWCMLPRPIISIMACNLNLSVCWTSGSVVQHPMTIRGQQRLVFTRSEAGSRSKNDTASMTALFMRCPCMDVCAFCCGVPNMLHK